MIQEKVKVLANTQLTPACWRLTLDSRSRISLEIKPGQFINLRITESMDPLFRRPFSVFRPLLLNSTEKGLEIVYKVVGRGTKKMTTLLPNDEVDILGPCGNGFWFEDNREGYVLLGGGVGAAALYMLGEEIARSQKGNLHVFLGGETKEALILVNEFKTLKSNLHISTDDGTFGFRGVITDLFRKSIEQGEIPSGSVVYACGPEPMYGALRPICEKYGFPAQISIERRMACGMGICLSCICKVRKEQVNKFRDLSHSHIQFGDNDDLGYALTCMDGPIFYLDEVILNE
jgi:dihydroorotate dehydrogenase electron transfer subunit